jgi:N-acetyl-beta-hexosaminidase
MGEKPNTEWATKSADTPPSAVVDCQILAVPFVKTGESVFNESTQVALGSAIRNAQIFYTTDGREPTLQSKVYTAPFIINETTTIKMFTFQEGFPKSLTVTARFKKNPSGPGVEPE